MKTYIPIEKVNDDSLTEETRKRYNRISSTYDQMEWFIEKYLFNKWRALFWGQARSSVKKSWKLELELEKTFPITRTHRALPLLI